jgi:tetratricopeptide (TPR) repeat protein
MPRLAFSQNSPDSLGPVLVEQRPGGRKMPIDNVRLAEMLDIAAEGLTDAPPSKIGRRLFDILPLTSDSTEDAIVPLELDFTQLPGDHVVLTLPWEALHDGRSFLAQRGIPVVRIVQESNRVARQPQNRSLSLLFQACAPEYADNLDFEKEETLILESTRESSLDLITEETGSLRGLASLTKQYSGRIDAIHLSGHADLFDSRTTPRHWLRTGQPCPAEGTPVFLMENELGDCELATAADMIHEAFGEVAPQLIFLSGCRTGEQFGSIPSMARSLIECGIPATIAWSRPVLDRTASQTAKVFYENLAAGQTVEGSVAHVLGELTQRDPEGNWLFPDWHLLQLYRDTSQLGPLVTKPGNPGRMNARNIESERLFLGAKPVAGMAEFVGRRRIVQRCLRSLSQDKIVVLWGAGGLGKSSVAARVTRLLSQRTPDAPHYVVHGKLDKERLRSGLGSSSIPGTSGEPESDIDCFDIPPNAIVVLDNFEENQSISPSSASGFAVDAQAEYALKALVRGLAQSSARLMITTRFWDTGVFTWIGDCHAESLTSMTPTEVEKKRQRMDLDIGSEHIQTLVNECSGNPRLLEQLAKAPFNEIGNIRLHYIENELQIPMTLSQLAEPERVSLERLAFISLPVPHFVASRLNLDLKKALSLGLIERSPGDFNISPFVRPLLPQLHRDEQHHLSRMLTPLLDQYWRSRNDVPLMQIEELLRLALIADDSAIACSNGQLLALNLRELGRWSEANAICESLLQRYRHYGTLIAHGGILRHFGRTQEALNAVQEGISLCPPHDVAQQTIAHQLLGSLLAVLGDPAAATEALEHALHLSAEMHSSAPESGLHNRAVALNNLAHVVYDTGDLDRAQKLQEEALSIYESLGEDEGTATTLNNLGLTHQRRGETARALELWQHSLEISDKIGDEQGKASTLCNIAGRLTGQGKITEALSLYGQALQFFESVGNARGQLTTMGNIAGLLNRSGESPSALDRIRTAKPS